MAPDSWKRLYDNTLAQVKVGRRSRWRGSTTRCARILRVKFRAGLFEAGRPSPRPLAGRVRAARLARASRGRAPGGARSRWCCSRTTRRAAARSRAPTSWSPGDGADNIAQAVRRLDDHLAGHRHHQRRLPRRDVDLGRHRAAVKAGGGSAELAPTAASPTKPDVAIVVFGEKPYAEFQGDLQDARSFAGR